MYTPVVYQDINSPAQDMIVDTYYYHVTTICGKSGCESIHSKHMIVSTSYYHMWDMIITRNMIVVTYNSIVGYLLKACDV